MNESPITGLLDRSICSVGRHFNAIASQTTTVGGMVVFILE